MKEIDKFMRLILAGESRKAKTFINSIYEKYSCEEYADALTAVILHKTRQRISDALCGFYIDEDYLMETMFSIDRRQAAAEITDAMCAEVKNCTKEDKKRIFLKAVSYIRENLADNRLYAGAVADYTGVSQTTLTKLFAENAGTTPTDYIGRLRVEKSMPVLTEGGKSVREVALSAGFSSTEAYIRAFKKIYILTPGKYIREKE